MDKTRSAHEIDLEEVTREFARINEHVDFLEEHYLGKRETLSLRAELNRLESLALKSITK